VVDLPRTPDLAAQREAMAKLRFLVGSWRGKARLYRGAEGPVDLLQSEVAGYRLDGLILLIEGVGRTAEGGKAVLQALGVVSYDDQIAAYRMRAFNDGRFLETEVKLLEDRGMTWGFTLGDIATRSILKIDENGAWTEIAEIRVGSQDPKKLLELTVYPER